MILLQTLWKDILPLLVFIGAGWFLDSKFKIQISTYTRFITYIVMPCFVFFSIYKSDLGSGEWAALPAAALLLLALLVLAFLLAKCFRIERVGCFSAAAGFSNTAYLGAVLIFLLFSQAPYLSGGQAVYLDNAMGLMALLMTFMHLTFHTLGEAMISKEKKSPLAFAKGAFTTPVLYAAVCAFLLKSSPFTLEGTFLYPVFHHFTGAFVVLTTVSVGLLVHRYHEIHLSLPLVLSSAMKLLISPLIALGLISALGGFSPLASQVFLLFAAIPAPISLILADADNPSLVEPVVLQMLLSFFTFPLVICLGQILFPLAV